MHCQKSCPQRSNSGNVILTESPENYNGNENDGKEIITNDK